MRRLAGKLFFQSGNQFHADTPAGAGFIGTLSKQSAVVESFRCLVLPAGGRRPLGVLVLLALLLDEPDLFLSGLPVCLGDFTSGFPF